MISVRPYGRHRHFAVYEDEVLLAVCCYRKGAEAVKQRLEMLLDQIERMKQPDGPAHAIRSAAAPTDATA